MVFALLLLLSQLVLHALCMYSDPPEYPAELYSPTGDILHETTIPGCTHSDSCCRHIFWDWGINHKIPGGVWPVASGDAFIPEPNGQKIRFWCYNQRAIPRSGEARKRGSFTMVCRDTEKPIIIRNLPKPETASGFGYPHVFGQCVPKREEMEIEEVLIPPSEVRCDDLRTPLLQAGQISARMMNTRGGRQVEAVAQLLGIVSSCSWC